MPRGRLAPFAFCLDVERLVAGTARRAYRSTQGKVAHWYYAGGNGMPLTEKTKQLYLTACRRLYEYSRETESGARLRSARAATPTWRTRRGRRARGLSRSATP
jgi:hypothetical protein